MLSPELLNELQQLNHSEKLRVVQLLVNDLASEDEETLFTNRLYEVWSPYDSASAAIALKNMLEAGKKSNHD